MSPKVAIIMGSLSDSKIMDEAKVVLEELGVASDMQVSSAHRTPHEVMIFAENARVNGYTVIIAGAGGAAHLPGVVAALTTLPVIGVPIKAKMSIDGWDSVLSILQMPSGVPVATVGLDSARNAGILAAQIIGTFDPQIEKNLKAFKEKMKITVKTMQEELKKK